MTSPSSLSYLMHVEPCPEAPSKWQPCSGQAGGLHDSVPGEAWRVARRFLEILFGFRAESLAI